VAQPYVGEIRMFGGNFAPVGWAMCNGQLMAISENSQLFQLIGTTYGGDGQQTFGLPDLRGRLPLHQTSGFPQGQLAGVETVTLNTSQLPNHTHSLVTNAAVGNQTSPTGAVLAQSTVAAIYYEDATNVTLDAATVGTSGGGQSHDNVQPFLCVNFIIALAGIFPSQS
jgi:microcystin-dependent protein